LSERVDVIDDVLAIEPHSRLDALREQRPEARTHTQSSYRAIFEPDGPAPVPVNERLAVALRVAVIHEQPELVAHYRARLEATAAAGSPSAESIAAGTGIESPRLAALLDHAKLLATAPAAATPEDIERLEAAGLEPDEIVIASHAIGFVSFQARVVAGLALLAEAGARP
jgi:CMD domain protein